MAVEESVDPHRLVHRHGEERGRLLLENPLSWRRHAFVLGAIFTPPDIISQFMLAVPVYLLFELGIFISRWVTPGIAEVERDLNEANREWEEWIGG